MTTSPMVNLAHLLFKIFIYVADADGQITPYEVQRFNRLLENTRWTTSLDLKQALDRLRQDYTTLWQAYEAKAPGFDLATISEQLDSTWFSQTADAAALRLSLRDFVAKIGQVGSPALARLGLVGATVSKATARATIEGLLAKDNPGSSAAAAASPSPRANATSWPAAALSFRESAVWRGGKIKVRCVNVIAETADVNTYSFIADPEVLFEYKPGQFVTLELSIGGKTLRRCYSISSSPTRPHLLSITVKRTPDGLVSNWLHTNLVEGQVIHLSGPGGNFTCLDYPAEKVLLISGGSGVTPMMSMLRWLRDTHSPVDIVFINNVRTPEDVIFARELRLISAQLRGKLKLAVVPGLVNSGQAWNGLTGPINDHMLQTFAPDFMKREVFVCGPTGYMTMIQNMLQQMGFPMDQLHQEAFSFAPAEPAKKPAEARMEETRPRVTAAVAAAARPVAPIAAPAAVLRASPPSPANEALSIWLQKSGKLITCSAGETILDAAESQGIVLASACRSGICGTCKLRKLSGATHMDEQKFLSEADIEEGYVLACVGHVHGRVVLDC